MTNSQTRMLAASIGLCAGAIAALSDNLDVNVSIVIILFTGAMLLGAFDPLLPELGDFESIELLVDQVFADYAEWRDDPASVNERSVGLAVITDSGCLDDLDLAELLDVQMSDQAVAVITDVDHVIWLLEDGTVYVTPVEDCSPVFQSNYFEG